MALWRLQTKTSEARISEYCKDNNIVAFGWSLRGMDIPINEINSIKTFEQYLSYAEKVYEKKALGNVKRLHDKVREGDLIWIKDNGKYYIGRVDKNSKWIFNTSKEAFDLDACNQLTNIQWYSYKESDESMVPGAVATSFIKGHTFQQIRFNGAIVYSSLLYDKLVGTNFYSDKKLNLNEDDFYSLLSPDDCEDLLCLWLYHKYGYVCIPSTNKKSTQLYECVLIDPKTGKHVYIQVKKGSDSIDANDYTDLKGEVWFLTTEGTVNNFNHDNDSNMHIAEPEKLLEFALSEESNNIMSSQIKTWAHFLK